MLVSFIPTPVRGSAERKGKCLRMKIYKCGVVYQNYTISFHKLQVHSILCVSQAQERKKKTCPKGNLRSRKKNSWTMQYNLGGRFTKSAHLTPGASQRFLCWKPNRQDAKSLSSYLSAISWQKKPMLKQTVLRHEYAEEC